MVRYSLALAGLVGCTAASAAADTFTDSTNTGGVFFHIAARSSSSGGRHTLYARQNGDICLKSQVSCDANCIDKSFECCHVGQGQACEQGYHCYSQGCCRAGQTCSGPPKGCTSTTKMCDIGCIPRDRVCCGYGDGSSCDSDTVCLKSGVCSRLQTELGSGGSSDYGGQPPNSAPATTLVFSSGSSALGGGPGSTRSPSTTATGSDGVNSAGSSNSGGYSLSPVTTTDGQHETTTTPTPGSPSTSKPKSTASVESTSASSDNGAAGATLNAPAILAGILAVAAYAI